MVSLPNFRVCLALSCLAAASGVLLGGCVVAEESPPPGATFKYPTESSFCTALAQADCNDKVVMACYGSDSSTLAADRQSCVSVRSLSPNCNPAALPYHPDHAEQCVKGHADLYAHAPSLTKDELAAAADACLAVFSRGGVAGTSCTADTDCDTGGGLRCLVKGSAGTCEKPVEKMGGDYCTDPAAQCVSGDYCSPEGYCVVQPTLGKACDATKPCADGLKCSDAMAGTCVAKLDNGAACTTADECAGGFCAIASGSAAGNCSATYQLLLTSTSCDAFRAP